MNERAQGRMLRLLPLPGPASLIVCGVSTGPCCWYSCWPQVFLNCLQTHSAVKLTQNSRICSVTSTGLCQALGLSVWVAAQDPGGARQENSACAVCVLDVTLEPLFRAAGIGGRKGLARGLQAWETERCEKLM